MLGTLKQVYSGVSEAKYEVSGQEVGTTKFGKFSERPSRTEKEGHLAGLSPYSSMAGCGPLIHVEGMHNYI